MIESIDNVKDFSSKSKSIHFASLVKSFNNVKITDEVITYAPTFSLENCALPTGARAKKIYYIDGEIYVYATSGYIFMRQEQEFVKISTSYFTSVPKLVSVNYNGKKLILVISNEKQRILDSTEIAVSLPLCDCAIVFEGVLLLGKDNTITFGKEYDYDNFGTNLNEGGQIVLPTDAGKILAIQVVQNNLFVVCAHRIFRLKIYGDLTDYKLENVATDYLDIEENTIASNSTKIYFINNSNLFCFDGNAIVKQNSILSKIKRNIIDNALIFGDTYVMPGYFGIVSGKRVYLYDKEGQTFISTGNLILGNGGYAIDSTDGNLYKISGVVKMTPFEIEFMPTDLEEKNQKAITSFWINLKGYANLKITGDNGVSATYKLVNGVNYRRIYFEANTFIFELSGTFSSLEIKDFSITYVIRGRK